MQKKIYVSALIACFYLSSPAYAVDQKPVQLATIATETHQQLTSTTKPAAKTAVAKEQQNAAESATKANTVTAEVKLVEKQHQLLANITLQQTVASAGKISVKWVAPEHSGCTNSVFALNYKNKTYHTRALRTIAHGTSHVCSGKWTAQVIDSNNKTLATAEYDVQVKQAQNEKPAASVKADSKLKG